MPDLLIGVDVGTQATKAALFTTAGQCLAAASVRSRLHEAPGGVVEEDPEYQLTTVCRAIRRCTQAAGVDAGDVAGVGVDGQMAGILGVGKDGRHVTPYDSWLDTRCAPYIALMDRLAGKRILSLTGCAPSFNHGPRILWWMHERKKVFRQIHAFVQPAAYAVMRLCGLDHTAAFIDGTYLHFSGFADNRKGQWDRELMARFDLDPGKLPRIVDPHDVVGELTATMARRCSLRAGTPVVAGCGDTAASFLACGATSPGICVDVAGTASVFAATATTFRADRKHRTLGCGRAAAPGFWHPYAYINGGGLNLEWFREAIAGHGRRSAAVPLENLNRMAEKVDMAGERPFFIPHMSGRVSPSEPDLRGTWANVTRDHTIADLYRAVLEGVTFEYGLYQRIVTELYPGMKFREIRITGGGETSSLWNRIKGAVLKTPVVRIADAVGAPMGSAMLAGYGVGLFSNLHTAAGQWVRKGTRFPVDRKLADAYTGMVDRYQELLSAARTFYERSQ